MANYVLNKNVKKTALVLVATLLFSFIGIIFSSFATAKADQVVQPSEEEIVRVADILKTTDESIIYDQNGVIMEIDVNKLAAKYGNQSEFEQINQILKEEYPQRQQLAKANAFDRSVRSSNSFMSCMKSQLLSYVGADLFAAMSVGGLQGLIQRKSWQEAAKLMLRYGKLGSVPIVAANLAFMAIQCA